jgi:hypothetical protein
MMILETVLSDRYVCQISCLSPQVKYLGEFFMLAATLILRQWNSNIIFQI